MLFSRLLAIIVIVYAAVLSVMVASRDPDFALRDPAFLNVIDPIHCDPVCLLGIPYTEITRDRLQDALDTHLLLERADSVTANYLEWRWSGPVTNFLFNNNSRPVTDYYTWNAVAFSFSESRQISVTFVMPLGELVDTMGEDFYIYLYTYQRNGEATYMLEFTEYSGWFFMRHKCGSDDLRVDAWVTGYLYGTTGIENIVGQNVVPTEWQGFDTLLPACREV